MTPEQQKRFDRILGGNRQPECQFCRVVHKVIVPTVHLNGTGATDLFDGLDGAVNIIRDAVQAVVSASPNGRDYYLQGDDAIMQVMNAHTYRLERLNAVRAELEEMRDHVQAVIDFQEEQKRKGRGA